MTLLLALWIILAVIFLLSLLWLKTVHPTATKTWSLLILLLCGILISALAENINSPWYELLSLMVIVVGGLGGSVPAAYCVSLLTTQKSEASETSQRLTGKLGFIKIQAEIPKDKPAKGADGGGRLIGIFERIALTLCLVTGQISVLAVIVAVKGLARYPDIKSGHLTAEKFIVGTFASLLWAADCALVALNLK